MGEEKNITIGRDRNCDIVLGDNTVSRMHAQLTFLDNGKLLLTDCHSTGGTKLIVNGKARRIHQELLSPLDTVEFGEMRLPVKELLEGIRLKYPAFMGEYGPVKPAPPPAPEAPQKLWVQGKRLKRCVCGAVVVPGDKCQECGR